MHKKSTFLLNICAALLFGAINAGAAEPGLAKITSSDPEHCSVHIANQDKVRSIEINFDGAQSVTLNPGYDAVFCVVSATGKMPQTSNMVSDYTTTIDGSKVTFGLIGKFPYGDEDGVVYSASSLVFMTHIPEGMFTVKGVDGLERNNEDTYIRFNFDNMGKVNPIGITDGMELTPDKLSRLMFPADLQINAMQQAEKNYIICAYPDGEGNPRVKMGNYNIALGPDGSVRASYNGNPFDLAPGKYYLVAGQQMMFKSPTGAVQKAHWHIPITVLEVGETSVQLVVASTSSLRGSELPVFQAYVGSGGVSGVIGADVTATIGDDVYVLDNKDGLLTFSEDDATALMERYLNKGNFDITVTAPAKSLLINRNGQTMVNSAVSETFTANIFTPMAAEDAIGTYYVQRQAFTHAEAGEQNLSGWDVTVAVDESSDYGDGITPVTITNFLNRGEVVSGLLNPAQRLIELPMQPFGDSDSDYLSNTTATVTDNGRIIIDKWAVVSISDDDISMLYSDGNTILVKADGIAPAAPAISATISTEGDLIAVNVTAPATGTDASGAEVALSNLTRLVVTNPDTNVVFSSNTIAPGESATYTFSGPFTSGTNYVFTAVAENCSLTSETGEASVYYSPITDLTEISGDYFVTSLTGSDAKNYLHQGRQFDLSGYNCQVTVITEPEEGDLGCHVQLTNYIPGYFKAPITGYLLFATRTIMIDMQQGNPEIEGSECYYICKDVDPISIETLAPAEAVLGYDGELRFDGWTIVDINSNNGSITKRFTDVKSAAYLNRHIAPKAPTVELSATDVDGVRSISGTVTVPTTGEDGSPLHAKSNGFNRVVVYRAPDEAPVATASLVDPSEMEQQGFTLVFEAEGKDCGEALSFADPAALDSTKRYTYHAWDENFDNTHAEPTIVIVEAADDSGIADIIGGIDAKTDIYTIDGVKLLEGADINAIGRLAPGIYITAGKKIRVGK